MQVIVDRDVRTPAGTFSRVYVDDHFQCFGLEDPPQVKKIPGRTRIAAGFYRLGVHRSERFGHYDQRFSPWHDGMIRVRDVPEFEGVLIHCGNTPEDTRGCLLVGEERDEGLMTIRASAAAYKALYRKIRDKVGEGGVWIQFRDSDK